MEQRLNLITLGVSDVNRSRRFYEQLGWQGQEVEETVFVQAGCIVLTLWSREKLALDSRIEQVDGNSGGFSGVVLAHNVRSEGEVAEVITAVVKAGGRVTRQPKRRSMGGMRATSATRTAICGRSPITQASRSARTAR